MIPVYWETRFGLIRDLVDAESESEAVRLSFEYWRGVCKDQ